MASTDTYVDVHGTVFGVKPSKGNVEARNFTIKTFAKGTYLSCTLWDNKHGHVEIKDGDTAYVNGKLTKSPKDGGGEWLNVSVYRIGVTPTDFGVDDREQASGGSSDEPDVL